MTVWTVPATVLRVVDADTLACQLDLGWHVSYEAKVRLAGLNAPEMSTEAGGVARSWVVARLMIRVGDDYGTRPIIVTSHSLDKYGRVLGTVFWDEKTPGVPGEVRHCLNDDLLAAGHAVPM
jgi:endonuclease YncB( thermonuclease family)